MGAQILDRMNRCWDAGGFVRVSTYLQYTDYKPKHREMFKISKDGHLYVQRGKRFDCLANANGSLVKFQFSA